MKLRTVGCSFTYAQLIGWPTMLANKLSKLGHDVVLRNDGHPGAGNNYIGDKIILESFNPNEKPDLVVIMWSGLTRKDICIDHTDKILMDALDGYHDYVRWAGLDTSYILSGGIKGSWEWNPMTKELFAPLYKVSNERSMAQDTLLKILSTQNWLKQNNVPYIMSSYVNYWTDADIVGQIDFGIKKFEDLSYLVNQIDFSQWAFVNQNKDCIYELGSTTPNGLEEDGFHPELAVHEMWAEILMNKLREQKFLG